MKIPVLLGLCVAVAGSARAAAPTYAGVPIAEGPFAPSWDSLAGGYKTPEWYRDAKFGIWAHWGPQCEPEEGDWYARKMYLEGEKDYKYHLLHYGPQSQFGFKDVIHEWKAENFDPEELLALYKKAGAKYFMALANHHDNFDNFNSKYQPWNAVKLGPHKDLIGMWAQAAHHQGLRFAVSVHATRSWSWYEVAQGADKGGPYAGVPYDGNLTKADGAGKWWDGLDPQELYAQRHPPGNKLVWTWNVQEGSSVPDQAYRDKFFLRTKQLWDDYAPDMIYFDDYVLPMHGVTDELGLKLLAHFYNSSIQRHGQNEAVINTKMLDEQQRKAVVYDIERGKASGILPQPWQTDTCLGDWHYSREIYEKHGYKSALSVITMLADIVSKNGNLMLNVPVKGDGTIDDDERRIVMDIGAWMATNGRALYSTRPWKVYGEGPSTQTLDKGQFGGLKDTISGKLTAEDIRFTQSKDGQTIFAIVLAGADQDQVVIHSLKGQAAPSRVSLVGGGTLEAKAGPEGLIVNLGANRPTGPFALELSQSG